MSKPIGASEIKPKRATFCSVRIVSFELKSGIDSDGAADAFDADGRLMRTSSDPVIAFGADEPPTELSAVPCRGEVVAAAGSSAANRAVASARPDDAANKTAAMDSATGQRSRPARCELIALLLRERYLRIGRDHRAH